MNESVAVRSIEQISGKKQRLFLDNGEVWVLYRGEIHTLHLAEGAELSDGQYQKIRTEILGKRAKKRAIHLLERMDRTEEQLRRKLAESEYPPDLIEDAIDYVKGYHYVDDARYADCYVRFHGETKSRGKLLTELKSRGIDRDLAEQVLAAAEDSRDEPAMIRKLLEKRRYDPQEASPQEKRRMYGYLMRRGFRCEDVCRAIEGR